VNGKEFCNVTTAGLNIVVVVVLVLAVVVVVIVFSESSAVDNIDAGVRLLELDSLDKS
jgi:hypothetical protein